MKMTEKKWKQIEEIACRHFGMEIMPSEIPKNREEVDRTISKFSYNQTCEIDRQEDCVRREVSELMDSWHNVESRHAGKDARI